MDIRGKVRVSKGSREGLICDKCKTTLPPANRDWREVAWEIQQASDATALIRPGDVLLVPGVE